MKNKTIVITIKVVRPSLNGESERVLSEIEITDSETKVALQKMIIKNKMNKSFKK
jgi:hypothetical protein